MSSIHLNYVPIQYEGMVILHSAAELQVEGHEVTVVQCSRSILGVKVSLQIIRSSYTVPPAYNNTLPNARVHVLFYKVLLL